MEYTQTIILKDGRSCCLRNGKKEDAGELLNVFIETHAQTDYLLTYPDENTSTTAQEEEFLERTEKSSNEIEIAAVVDGKIVGSAGIESLGSKYKIRHRAEFGISILKDYWGLGIGSALTDACITCVRKAGYTQLELNVVAENATAIALYESKGFVEFGRNPKGFYSKNGYQELVYMRLEL